MPFLLRAVLLWRQELSEAVPFLLRVEIFVAAETF
jgi:hypothetical protein